MRGSSCGMVNIRYALIGLLLGPMLFFGCSFQDRLLYYPDRSVPGDAELASLDMRFWPGGRDGYRGFLSAAPEPSAGTVIIFHGNAATAADRTYYLEPLRRLGYRVLLAEYPGYGGREGKLGEESFVRDASETIRLAAQMYGRPLYLLGESLGGAIAPSAARTAGVSVEGMVLVTPWATLEKVAKEKFPWLPVRLLMGDRYDTVSNLREFRGRVAVVEAERDTIIPPHHARELYRTFPGRKMMWTIRGADHNDWPAFITDRNWGEIMEFLAGAG
ncbi:alpha/beta hydrolase [Geobacter sp. DSM 9736]|uniref:alpha/beta hydrolase n=1 Tax=Geobacter sp. DSM 9736 TaxID=1277350 RepID=UPI000B50DA9C|nr:alpha/beta fold hydrolase [Geobacter sp. DSM 9736]SNB46303.1 hypothetical protein SAMN06269301_1752 [Geobacter sp. DSM 9736]